jgi:hypothetical protein
MSEFTITREWLDEFTQYPLGGFGLNSPQKTILGMPPTRLLPGWRHTVIGKRITERDRIAFENAHGKRGIEARHAASGQQSMF